jgi:hypothetical protein
MVYMVKRFVPSTFAPKRPKEIAVQRELAIPLRVRFEHTHILAGSGYGKTKAIEHLIVNDLKSDSRPSIVVIDSQGHMLKRIARLACFAPGRGGLTNELIIVDPTDVDHPPALNVFAIDRARLAGYGKRAQIEIVNGIIELYHYLFSSLLEADTTQRQKRVFSFCARLLVHAEGATIQTLREILEYHTTHYEQVRHELDSSTQEFFEKEITKRDYRKVRDEVLRRLWGIMEDPTLLAMFSARQNRVDFFQALNTRKIILINTAIGFLKGQRSSLLGRTFITLILQAVLERASLPERELIPTILYIDEASEYFDETITDFLRMARKYNTGILLAHQALDQCKSDGLKASIASNTSIKLAGGISDRDARALAPDMRCEPKFINEQRKTRTHTTFATYVRNVTPKAVTMTVPFNSLEREPQMTSREYQQLITNNRARVSGGTEPPGTPMAPPVTTKM